MKAKLTASEIQATLDAIDRFRANDPGLKKTYEIEFVVANATSSALDLIRLFLNQNEIGIKELKNWESDVIVVIEMKLDNDRILNVESSLTYFANKHGFKYDGWGAFE